MNIKNVKWQVPINDDGTAVTNASAEGIIATIDGISCCVPLDPANRHYAAIMEQVNTGTLTIAEADNGE
jgi:hypothetical protein